MKNNQHVLNLDNIILIDNLPSNFLDTQFFNGIPIKDFTTDKNDTALKILKNFFKNYLQQIFSKAEDCLQKQHEKLCIIIQILIY